MCSLLYFESKKLKLENRITNYFKNFQERNIYLNQFSNKIDRIMYLDSLNRIKTISEQLEKTINNNNDIITTTNNNDNKDLE